MIKNKEVSIIGISKSGIASAELLSKYGNDVFLSELRPAGKIAFDAGLYNKYSYETGKNSDRILNADIIVVSPGVPTDIPILDKAHYEGIPVIGEIELAYLFAKAKFLAVTGTNGKTTTTTLLGKMIEKRYKGSITAGNMGIPLTSVAEDVPADDYIVAEISSFQLATIDKFQPKISYWLNFAPDHLDRYDSLAEYAGDKYNIFKNQTSDDYAIVNYEDAFVREMASDIQAAKYYFGSKGKVPRGIYLSGNDIVINTCEEEIHLFGREIIRIPGLHNVENVMAASLGAWLCKVPIDDIKSAVSEFGGVENRLENVGEIRGIKFFNDSIATTVHAVSTGLKSFDGRLRVLMGGRNKGLDFTGLIPVLRDKATKCYLFGEAAGDMAKVFGNTLGWSRHENLESAMSEAFAEGTEGDTIVLSPACASFDQYTSYVARGKDFKRIFNILSEENKG